LFSSSSERRGPVTLTAATAAVEKKMNGKNANRDFFCMGILKDAPNKAGPRHKGKL
jgi:hypothetical protein